MKPPFCGITYEILNRLLVDQGFNDQYSLKTVTNFYRRRITGFNSMKNLPLLLRNKLESAYSSGLFYPVEQEESADRSVRYLFRTPGNKTFETVFIPENRRKTICLSTQSGCRMGCPFCLTGRYDFKGNLNAGEMVNQVMSIPHSRDITHVVFMGMGEPLDNIDEVLTACRILTSPWGLSLGPAHVTVSTVGITPAVERFLNESDCNLTLSLFSPFPGERARVVPVEKVYPSIQILELMMNHPPSKKRRFSIAYVMIHAINDSEAHLKELIRMLKGSAIRVNLLPYHMIPDDSCIPSPAERIEYFRQRLTLSGISASIRRSRGADISAACGLLAAGLKKQTG